MGSPYLSCTASQTPVYEQKPRAPLFNQAPPPPEPAHLPWRLSSGDLWGDESGYTTCTMENNASIISTGRSNTVTDGTVLPSGWSFSPSIASQTTVCEPQSSEVSSFISSLNDARDNNLVSEREAEAQEVLWTSTDWNEIRLVCLFFPFYDPKTRLEILSKRLPATLDDILKCLPTKKHLSTTHYTCNDNLNKAEEILRRIESDLRRSPIWNWEWSPPIATSTSCATKIADAIDSEISSALHNVPFTELVRAACNRRSDVVTDLLDGLSNMCCELWRRSEELLQPKDNYALVEKVRAERTL